MEKLWGASRYLWPKRIPTVGQGWNTGDKLADIALPEKLYKYFGPHRISFLEDRLVCFSTPKQLNAPFEGVSRSKSLFPQEGGGSIRERAQLIDFKREAYKRLYQNAMNQGASVSDAHIFAQSIVASSALMEQAKEAIIQFAAKAAEEFPLDTFVLENELASLVGVFCLSSNPVSAPMWAHYGCDYSGFAVEFSTQHDFLSGAGIKRVRPVTYEMRVVSNWTGIDDSDLLARKSEEWSYEQEWRTARILETATKIASGFHLFEVAVDAVTGILIGELSEPSLIAKAKEAKLRYGWPIKRVAADRIEKKLTVLNFE